uniref:Glycoside hydrolase family 5 domain-containing protein n=1 Tax=Prevotella sp. GTC17260 TaxID=3236796 RepID=A0AB33JBQ5_9BACT
MKRILLAAIGVLVACQIYAVSPVKRWGQLQVKGSQLCNQAGEPVVLRGVSYGWHNLWPRFYNAKSLKWLVKDWNVSVVRAAMGIQIDNNYLDNPELAMKCMTPIIEGAIKNNIYVIIDWHAHKMHTQAAADFFGKMAQKYGKYPNVIYELYNEPVEDSWDSLKEYAQTVIRAIRQHDPDNIILMGCPHWDQDIHLVAASPLQGVSNVMYTLHFYAATHKEYLRQRMAEAIDTGLPVFVSECAGMEASGDGPLNMEEWQKWIDLMESKKISWVNWSISDKKETCSMLLPSASSTGKWKDTDLNESGKLVRKFIRQYNR